MQNNLKFTFENAEGYETRLDVFLHSQLSQYSRQYIQNQIKSGNVLINNNLAKKPNTLVKINDRVDIEIAHIEKQSFLVPKKIPLSIVYEDEDIIILDKQASVITHPGVGESQNTIANALKYHFGENLSTDEIRPGIVHRLDKDTSGLMVIAKNDVAHANLANQIKERSLTRTYTALIWGALNSPFGKISTLLTKSNLDHTKMMVSQKEGKKAITHYKVIKRAGDDVASLITCTLETGRTHQIRVHMAYYKHPLIGDLVYGKGFNPKSFKILPQNVIDTVNNFKRQALHSSYMKLLHPVSGKELEFSSSIETSPNAKDILEVKKAIFDI